MFKKVLSLSMTLVLLLAALSVGMVLNTSAADLSASLIAGKTPIDVSGSSCTTGTAGTLADMTDGKLRADGGTYWKATDWGGACSV